jgi:hypothetical protein
MSRFNFTLSKLCGTVHTGGNLEYVHYNNKQGDKKGDKKGDKNGDNTLLSIVGNR